MELGQVIGSVWATKKDEKLNGQKLLIVKLVHALSEPEQQIVIAADIIGAGAGDRVLVVRGSSARNAVLRSDSSVDAAIVGIVDSVVVEQDE